MSQHSGASSSRSDAPQAVDARTCTFETTIDANQALANRVVVLTNQLRRALDYLSGPQPLEMKDKIVSPSAQITTAPRTIAHSWDDLCCAVDELQVQVDRLY